MSRPLDIPAVAPLELGEPLVLQADDHGRLSEEADRPADRQHVAGHTLLVFLNSDGAGERWLLLREGTVAERGEGLDGLGEAARSEAGAAARIVGVVPGDAVTVHWIAMPRDLSLPQASSAARLAASELSAQPIDDLHVAVGLDGGETEGRIVALVPALAMAGWLSHLAAAGLDPDVLIPEPFLLPAPVDEGFVRLDREERSLVRGPADAFVSEAALADFILADANVHILSPAQLEEHLPQAVAAPAINLRQGPFAKARRWKIEWRLVRRLTRLSLGLMFVTLVLHLVALVRYTQAADALDAQAQAIALTALPASARGGDPVRALALRAADGGGASFTTLAGALFTAVQSTPNVEVVSMRMAADRRLRATVRADAPATLTALQQAIAANGFAAVPVGPLPGGPWQPAEIMVQSQ